MSGAPLSQTAARIAGAETKVHEVETVTGVSVTGAGRPGAIAQPQTGAATGVTGDDRSDRSWWQQHVWTVMFGWAHTKAATPVTPESCSASAIAGNSRVMSGERHR